MSSCLELGIDVNCTGWPQIHFNVIVITTVNAQYPRDYLHLSAILACSMMYCIYYKKNVSILWVTSVYCNTYFYLTSGKRRKKVIKMQKYCTCQHCIHNNSHICSCPYIFFSITITFFNTSFWVLSQYSNLNFNSQSSVHWFTSIFVLFAWFFADFIVLY